MPRQTSAQYRASLRNLKKARKAQRGGARRHRKPRRRIHRGGAYRTPAQRRASKRNVRHAQLARRMHGGAFSPGMLMQAHNTLKEFKPLTNLVKLGDALGVSAPISKFMDKTSVGRAVKKGFNFLRSTLGYGIRRRVVRHPMARIRVRPHLRQVGGTLQYVRGHLKAPPRAGRY